MSRAYNSAASFFRPSNSWHLPACKTPPLATADRVEDFDPQIFPQGRVVVFLMKIRLADHPLGHGGRFGLAAGGGADRLSDTAFAPRQSRPAPPGPARADNRLHIAALKFGKSLSICEAIAWASSHCFFWPNTCACRKGTIASQASLRPAVRSATAANSLARLVVFSLAIVGFGDPIAGRQARAANRETARDELAHGRFDLVPLSARRRPIRLADRTCARA